MVDLDRLTRAERELWHAAHATGRAEVLAERPIWRSGVFWLTAAAGGFAAWVGYHLIIDPALEIERGAAVVAMVIAALWKYTDDRKAATETGG